MGMPRLSQRLMPTTAATMAVSVPTDTVMPQELTATPAMLPQLTPTATTDTPHTPPMALTGSTSVMLRLSQRLMPTTAATTDTQDTAHTATAMPLTGATDTLADTLMAADTTI